jgi:hypothetical protein
MGSHKGNRRRVLMQLVESAALLAFLFIVQPASADTIRFVDATNTITVVHNGTARTITLFNTQTSTFGDCSATETYQCDVYIASKNGATPTSPDISRNISEAGINPTVAVSDTVFAQPASLSNKPAYLVIFASDRPGDLPSGGLGLTPAPGAPVIIENGDIQTAFTLSWSDNTSDTIEFRSNLDPVPEPGTLVLFGSSLVMASGFLRRRSRLV